MNILNADAVVTSQPCFSSNAYTVGGKYGLLVPFFNAICSGKVGRFSLYNVGANNALTDIQELDMTMDRVIRANNIGLLRGFRGGFVGNWMGTRTDDTTACGIQACACFNLDYS